MKNSIAVFILSLLVCAGSAIAWPWGNVGLNVDEPEEQLDVGGNVMVRSNLIVKGASMDVGDINSDSGLIRMYNIPQEEWYEIRVVEDGFRFVTHNATLEIFGEELIFNNGDDLEMYIRPISSPVTGIVYKVGAYPNYTIWTNTP